PADTDVRDAIAFPRCPNKNFTRPANLDTLADQHLLVAVCNAISHHPTGSTARRRTGGRIFAAVEKHARAHFKRIFTPFWTKKVEEAGPSAFQEFSGLGKAEL